MQAARIRRSGRRLVAALVLLLAAAGPAAALDRFGLSLGAFDFTREHETVQLGLDAHFAPVPRLFRIVPVVGAGATGDQAYWAYVGVRRPIRLGQSAWLLAPNFAVSVFDEGDGKDLGYAIEFRSGLELLRELHGGMRVGAGFYHMSNARLSDTNPGANSLLLRLILPVHPH